MEVLEVTLTTVLVIVSIILVLLILIQSNRSAGMGLFGGGASQTAFGSSSADVLTKITGGLAALFMLITLSLAFMKSKVTDKDALQREFDQANQSKQATEGAAADPDKSEAGAPDKTEGADTKTDGASEADKGDKSEKPN